MGERGAEENFRERGAFPAASSGRDQPPRSTARPSVPAPASAPPASASPPSQEAQAEGPSTSDLLRDLEASRASFFFQAGALVNVLVIAALPLLPGATWLRFLTGAACFSAAAMCGAMLVIARDPRRYTPQVALASALVLSPLAVVIIYYLGLYSASATFLSVGIYFYGTSQSRAVAWTAYATTALLYFVFTLSIAVDVIPDLAVFSAAHVPTTSRLYRVVMQQAIFAMMFYLARSARRSTQVALERAKSADVVIKQKEAQLMEATGDLDRALRPADGRLSGQPLGDYRLGDLLGRGGMGEVYGAEHVHTGARVAIKLVHDAMLEDPTNVERFIREAQATSAVPTEHVPRVLGSGTAPSGTPYLVMELLEGHDLGWHLRRRPQLDLQQVVEMVEHTARALSAVRDAGIVHRDLKPGNLFLTDTLPRQWKVLDFGLSKLQGASTITKEQAVGTPAYMAPEQIRGKDVDHLADLYALTAIAYRTLTGRPPFVGNQVAKVLMDVITKVPDAPGLFVKLPVEVELVLAIGLAKRKESRFDSVERLAKAFRLAASGELDQETRSHGWALLKQHPWGSAVKVKL
jgi:serine/threonine-protein kinase